MTMRFGVRVATVVLAGLSALPALAAVDVFMTIKGTTQGAFKGEASPAGHPEEIRLESVTQGAALGSAKFKQRVLVITKAIGVASPQLEQAAANKEDLAEVTIRFAEGNGKGKMPTAVERVELKHAAILSRRVVGQTEVFRLTYQQILVTHVNGGTSTTDDWLVPND